MNGDPEIGKTTREADCEKSYLSKEGLGRYGQVADRSSLS